jgi:hypothetical protein
VASTCVAIFFFFSSPIRCFLGTIEFWFLSGFALFFWSKSVAERRPIPVVIPFKSGLGSLLVQRAKQRTSSTRPKPPQVPIILSFRKCKPQPTEVAVLQRRIEKLASRFATLGKFFCEHDVQRPRLSAALKRASKRGDRIAATRLRAEIRELDREDKCFVAEAERVKSERAKLQRRLGRLKHRNSS